MIIDGERVTPRQAIPLLHHLLHGEKNDRVTQIQGTAEDAHVAIADARDANRKFCWRHFIISPESETTRADAMMIYGLLARDFGFDPTTGIGFEHIRPRAVARAFGAHWHFLVPEIDAAGKVMDSRFNFLRHVKVARIADYRLGHNFVRSQHDKAVLAALESDGFLDVAAALNDFIENDPDGAHRAAFSRNTHQKGKRLGVDIPAARAAVRAAWETTAEWTEFTAALGAAGLSVSTGDRDHTLIVQTDDGVFVGAAHRLARVRKRDLQKRKDASNEQPAAADQRARDAGADSVRYQAGLVDTADPGRQPAGGITAGGPRHTAAVEHPHDITVPSDQPGSDAPAAGYRGALDLRRLAVVLRVALHRDPVAAGYLLDRARQLARSPLDRVIVNLDKRETQLKSELQELTTPAPAARELLAARQQLAEAKANNAEAADAVRRERERREHHRRQRPQGLIAAIRGDKQKWSGGLAEVDARVASFETAHSAAWLKKERCEAVVADLEKAHRRKTHIMLTSPDRQKQLLDCQRGLRDVAVARQIVTMHPAIAFGGFTVVMAAAAAGNFIGRLFTPQIETDPLLPF